MKELDKKKTADPGIGNGHTLTAMLIYRKGIQVMKDVAVTRKMVLENLASWFCPKVLTVLILFLQDLQITR